MVIGGGAVAERKVEGLLGAGAAVTVVSPTLTSRLTAWAREGRIVHREREYRSEDLAGAQLAFVATEDGRVNEAVAHDARAAGVWVNAADDPAHCDFILLSVLRRGHLVVAVTTGQRLRKLLHTKRRGAARARTGCERPHRGGVAASARRRPPPPDCRGPP